MDGDGNETKSETELAPEHDAPPPKQNVPSEDWLLESLLRIANANDDFQLPVTMIVDGAVVTGMLISMKHFFAEYGKWWRTGSGDSDVGVELEAYWSKVGTELTDRAAAESEPDYNFVHLKNAFVSAGFGLAPSSGVGVLWRVRLAHVSGFSLGALKPGKVSATATFDRKH